jgi:hypothetical protein
MYSATRVATLVAVILCLVGSDYTAQVDCQVCHVHHYLMSTCVLMGHDPQVEIIFQFVSLPPNTLGLSN